jgi:hypothetical protein
VLPRILAVALEIDFFEIAGDKCHSLQGVLAKGGAQITISSG